ncbi:MAG: hypothetical protein LBG29_00525 [Synergistaceae bacterium]|nr:hypothetical protein [Synergistaceae bacterium]
MIKARKRRAFSLIAVIAIAIAGLALVGGILYTFQAFSGASMQVTSSSWEYNFLQEAVEQGKAFLRNQTLSLEPGTDEPLTWKESDSDKIENLTDLLIRDKDGKQIGHLTSRNINERGLNGTLNLYIYSMAYTSDDISVSIPAEDRAQLPPSFPIYSSGAESEWEEGPLEPGAIITSDDIGTSGGEAAYLIRATFTDNVTHSEKSIETAIVQSMKAP